MLISVLIALIALFHIFVFWVESIAWRSPGAMRMFKTTPESAAATRVLALNQGIYNLFLAAGLICSLIVSGSTAYEAKIFFLSCVAIAGVVGGLSVSKRILFVQALPALITLALVLFYR